MDARALNAYAGANGIDAVVVAFYGYLGTLARDAGYSLDAD